MRLHAVARRHLGARQLAADPDHGRGGALCPHHGRPLGSAGGGGGGASDREPLFEEALYAIISQKQASSSFLMRKLGVGYARSAKIIDQLEDAGVVGPRDGSKPRELLITDPSLILGNSSDSAQEKID